VKSSSIAVNKDADEGKSNLPAPDGMDQMLKIVCSTIARRESMIFRYVFV